MNLFQINNCLERIRIEFSFFNLRVVIDYDKI